MMKIGKKINRKASFARVIDLLGDELVHTLSRISSRRLESVYLTGGTVRDLLLGRTPVDIDLTVQEDAGGWAAELAEQTGGTLVPLGRDEDAARVVWRKRDIDFSSFREGAATIDAELGKRDITINSMALLLRDVLKREGSRPEYLEIIDPAGGIEDLARQRIRLTSDAAFRSDPLRLLRVYRFAAVLGFTLDEKTGRLVRRERELLTRAAPERIAYELNLIMRSPRAASVFRDMAETELLFEVFPEFRPAVGMEQPASHHLDVFEHSLAVLRSMEQILEGPGRYFTSSVDRLEAYIETGNHLVQLKWAALFHDLGKPPTHAVDPERGDRITFHNHDRTGEKLVSGIARRLRWSRETEKAVALLVGLHMRPFFLCNVRRKGELTVRACLRLLRSAGEAFPGLFLLAMADASAGKGAERPGEMEEEIASLFAHMEEVRRKHLEPVRSGPPLLTGRDLREELQLEPGPLFREILTAVEEAHMEKLVGSRKEALDLAAEYIRKKKEGRPENEDL
jgi:poly(A) polymerase